MTALIEYLPLIIGMVAAVVLIVVIASRGTKTAKETEAERLDDIEAELPDPSEIPLVETRVCVETMECGTYIAGVKTPRSGKTFLVTFRTDTDELLEYTVEEELYLSLSEGDTGTLATLNGFFYGFAPDSDENDEPPKGEPAEESATEKDFY